MSASNLAIDDDLAAFAAGAIGGGLPAEVHALMEQAALLQHDPEQAQRLLEQARAAVPRHPAPLIALYRFHFYGHRLKMARAVGEDALAIARTALGSDFGDEVPSEDDARHNAAVRFYLFVLKGLAYLNMRLRDMEEAHLYLNALRRLDPEDHVRGAVLAHMLQHFENGGGTDTAPHYPVRGWPAPTP